MQVDHEAVRQLAIQIGVRSAARKLGLNEDRVCQWSKREQWFAQPPRQGDVSTVSKPGDVLLAAIANDNQPTRYALSKAHRKAAEHAETLDGEELLKPATAQALRHHGAGASLVHQWEEKQQQNNVMVNIALLGVQPSDIQVDMSDAAARTIDLVNDPGTDHA